MTSLWWNWVILVHAHVEKWCDLSEEPPEMLELLFTTKKRANVRGKITQFRISICCRTPSHSLSLTCHVADDSLQVLQHPPATGARARLPLLRHHGPDTLAQHKPTHGASELSRGAVPLMCGPHPSVFLHSAQHLVNSQWRSQEVLSDATEAFH